MTARQSQWLIPAFLLAILLSGCVRITDPGGKDLQVSKDSAGYFVSATENSFISPNKHTLVPVVKGSIYETGELMSVFGTCLDENNNPINDTYAEFNAWYPNGTQFIFSQNMSQLFFTPGYFLHQSTMQNVQGTYLTSMDCKLVSDPAVKATAFGEWQNPYWVKRLALLNDTLAAMNTTLGNLTVNVNLTEINQKLDNLTNTTQNISIQIGNISVNMENSFNITWSKIDQLNATLNTSVYALNQSIYYVAAVANASVDRNDSYLAHMMQNLTALELAETPPSSTPLNHTEDADDPVYQRNWYISVDAINPTSGKKVKSPDSFCTIFTTITPVAVQMTPQGEHFVYNELITIHGDFSWTVTCAYT